MNHRGFYTGIVAIAGLLGGASASQAGDVYRLGLASENNADTMKLGQVSPEAETLKTFCHRSFFCGFGGGFRVVSRVNCFGPTFFAPPVTTVCAPVLFQRRVFVNRCLPRAFVSTPVVSTFSFATPPVVVSPSFSLSTVIPTAPPVIQKTLPPGQLPFPKSSPIPAQPQPGPQGTYDYDGGPSLQIPMPQIDSVPMKSKPTQTLEGIPVSITIGNKPRYRYPAYGEKPEGVVAPVLRSVSR